MAGMNPHPLRLLISSYSLALAVALVLPNAGLVTQGMIVWLGGAGFVFVLAMTPGIRTWFTADLGAPNQGSHGEIHVPDVNAEFHRWDEDARMEALNHEADAEAQLGQPGRTATTPKRRSA